MTIFDYYITQQENPMWYKKFQSTADNQSGKIFSYINTNFRTLLSFLVELNSFEINDGRDRSQWGCMERSGQELDKHRVVNLQNAGLIKESNGKYSFTSSGYAAYDLATSNFDNSEKWFLLFLLVLNYRTFYRSNDIFYTTKDYFRCLEDGNLDVSGIIDLLKNVDNIKSRNDLFHSDVFWNITFARDSKFLKLYNTSTIENRKALQDYVFEQNQDKHTKDCIAHKYINSGAYAKNTFIDECKMLYITWHLLQNDYSEFSVFYNKAFSIYCNIQPTVKRENIDTFILANKSIYSSIFEKSLLKGKNNV